MDSRITLEIIAVFILVLANGFFALSEFSIIASRKSKLKQQAEDGKSGSKTAYELQENSDHFLASVQVGITLLSIMAGVFGGATIVTRIANLVKEIPIDFIASSSQTIAVVAVAIMITMVSVVFGELIPKYLALSNPEKFSRFVAPPVSLFSKLTYFFSKSLSQFSNFVLKIFGVDTSQSGSHISEDEINHMILEGREKGVFDETEEELIRSVFDFSDSTVRRAMTPRTDVIGLNINMKPKDIIDTIIEHGYSRYPVFESTLDNISGILYTKDIIVHRIDPNLIIIKDLIRETIFVPDSMPLSNLLNIFKKQKKHIAVVLDEFGGTAGIITLEDLLEEIVGEIQDEYDTEIEPLVKQSDTIAFADGAVWPGDVNELLYSHLPEDKAETLAGLIIDHTGTLPDKDQITIIEDIKFSILKLDNNRIIRLKLEKIPNLNDEYEKED